MSKTLRARQADWRGRRDFKSVMFDALNADRIRHLRQGVEQDKRPEVAALQEFFVSYPRCYAFPLSIEFGQAEGCWSVALRVDYEAHEAAAAIAALEEVTSVPIRIEVFGDGWGGIIEPGPALLKQVRDEVAEMRRLNIWGK